MDYLANPPKCAPLLIFSPMMNEWDTPYMFANFGCVHCPALGPPRRQGLSSRFTHLWTSADLLPLSGALGTPLTARSIPPMRPLVGHFWLYPRL